MEISNFFVQPLMRKTKDFKKAENTYSLSMSADSPHPGAPGGGEMLVPR